MTSFVRRLLTPGDSEARSTDLALSLQQWAEQVKFGGLSYGLGSQTLTGTTEDIAASFQGYVEGAYKSNGIVFACCVARMLIFSEARFQYQRMRDGKPGDLFSKADLAILETPWPNGTTGDLLSRAIGDVDMAGNSYTVRLTRDRLKRARPDWMTILIGSKRPDWEPGDLDGEVIGYLYHPNGRNSGRDPVPLLPEHVAHWAPIPDPTAEWRGMSWITPIIREIMGDKAAMEHKLKFFDNGATVNLVVKLPETIKGDAFKQWVALFKDAHDSREHAYETVFMGGGGDIEAIGADMKEIDFKVTQGHGETRIAAAARIPPIIVGLSEGLEAATYCLPFSARVWTRNGPRPIGEITAGDKVWAHDGEGLTEASVSWQSQTGVLPVYTVKTKNRTLRATGNHPVLTRVAGNSGGNNASRSASVVWRAVAHLREGDYIVQPLGLPDGGSRTLPGGDTATPEVMQWLGAMVGDGCVADDGTITMCMPKKGRVRAYYEAIPVRLFTKSAAGQYRAPGRLSRDGSTAQMVALRNEGLSYRAICDRLGLTIHPMSVRDRIRVATRDYCGDRLPVRIRQRRNAFAFGSKRAAQWHREMGVTGTAKTKRIPGWVFGTAEDLRLAFLAGLVDSDGSVDRRGALKVAQANRELVEDLRVLAISCGIECSNVREDVFQASCLPQPGTQPDYRSWTFTASSAVSVARVPFADPVYRERVEANAGRHRPGGRDAVRAGLTDGLGFYRVTSVEEGPPEPVYDIEVEGHHSFVAEGIVVHNSNYGQARRAFADSTMRPLWRGFAGAMASIVTVPPDARLWYDAEGVAFLQEDVKDAADIQQTRAVSIRQLIEAGFTPESVVDAIDADDMRRLKHTGLFSVQLQEPGTDHPNPSPIPAVSGQNGRRLLEEFVASTRN